MKTWRDHMPPGMLLKSDGFASNLSDPAGACTLERYCMERGEPYDDRKIPVRLDTFVNYGWRSSNGWRGAGGAVGDGDREGGGRGFY